MYKEANQLNVYRVSFSFPAVSGTVCVKAKDEDEAEDIVSCNMYLNCDNNPCSMYDDSDVVEDIELNENCDCDCTIDDVEDEGEYEE